MGSPEVSPKPEGELVTSPECHDQHADPFDPEKPRKVRPVRTTHDPFVGGDAQWCVGGGGSPRRQRPEGFFLDSLKRRNACLQKYLD